MDDWKKIVQVMLAIGIVAVGIRLYMVYRERHEPVAPPRPAETSGYTPTVDDYVYLKQIHPEKPEDLKPLIGTTVWMQIADQLPYFPATGTRVDYTRQVGVLRGATPLNVTGVVQAKAPASVITRVPNGDRQVLLTFTTPAQQGTFAVPMGYEQAGEWKILADQALFYEDPHTLYKWPPQTWQAIAQHNALKGMTEEQAGLALGQIETSDGQIMGDRTVHYDNLGHPVDVTFVKGHATSVTPAR